jgi:hypothetical protein
MDTNEHKYYFLKSVFIRVHPWFPYPLSSFLFPISALKDIDAKNHR